MIKIKKAGLGDLDQLSDLFDGYRKFYREESDLQMGRAFLQKRIENKESEIFVSVYESKILTGFVQLYPIFSSTRMKRLWLLNDLYVLSEYRGLGISVGLIQKAKELCVTTDSCGMILETARNNEIGNKLYHKTGFILDEEHNYYSWDRIS